MLARTQDLVDTVFLPAHHPEALNQVCFRIQSPCIQHTGYISIFDKVDMIKNHPKCLVYSPHQPTFSALWV